MNSFFFAVRGGSLVGPAPEVLRAQGPLALVLHQGDGVPADIGDPAGVDQDDRPCRRPVGLAEQGDRFAPARIVAEDPLGERLT